MIAKVIWIEAIIQRPVIRLRTSRSASRLDSPSKRSARSSVRPIVFPSRIPETESDSCTIDDTSASDACRSAVTFLRCAPTRFVSQTNSGQQREREDREPPVEQQHRDDRREHGRDVREHRRRRRRDDVLDPADVVRDPALHLARARPGEERERQALEVAVDLRAQVVHDALADLVREERLPDADDAGDDRDRDHAGHERSQQTDVLLRDRDVEHLAQQERRDDADRRGEDDQRADRAEARAVRPEEPEDPPEVRLADGRVRRPLEAARRRRRSRSDVRARP